MNISPVKICVLNFASFVQVYTMDMRSPRCTQKTTIKRSNGVLKWSNATLKIPQILYTCASTTHTRQGASANPKGQTVEILRNLKMIALFITTAWWAKKSARNIKIKFRPAQKDRIKN